jgi:hypothetical protein
MRTSWEKLVQYVDTDYGQDINNKLQSKVWVILTEPVHANDVLARHSVREVMIRNGQTIFKSAVQARKGIQQRIFPRIRVTTMVVFSERR